MWLKATSLDYYFTTGTTSGMIKPKNVAMINVQIAIKIIKPTEYLNVNLNSSDSLPANPTAAHAIAILCGLIILPTTPPTEFAARNNASLTPSSCALTRWSVPKRRFELVSLPVKNTPIQPIIGLKNANALPVVCAKKYPSVLLIAEFLAIKANATTSPIVTQGIAISLSVSPKHSVASSALMRSKKIVKNAVNVTK